jgi:protein-S-isoprenylcysteine O-methyltransferase Ste14
MLVPPPTYPLLLIALTWWLRRGTEPALPRGPFAWIAAALLLGLGAAIAVSALRTLRAARTAVEPWKPSKRLITHGVFARSRNPIYLAFLLVQAGAAWALGNVLTLLAVPLTWLLLDRLQVRREERYLSATFGDDYAQYCTRTPRWL